jgi:hypothetical protein
MASCCRRAKFSRANSRRSLNRDLREAIRQKRISIMDAKVASLRQKRQRFQCGRGCGKGQAATSGRHGMKAKTGRGDGARRHAPSPPGAGTRFRAQFSAQVRRPPLPGGSQAVSLGRIGPLVDLLKPRNIGIVSYGSVGCTRRRTLRPVPEFQVAQDLFDHGAVVDANPV